MLKTTYNIGCKLKQILVTWCYVCYKAMAPNISELYVGGFFSHCASFLLYVCNTFEVCRIIVIVIVNTGHRPKPLYPDQM